LAQHLSGIGWLQKIKFSSTSKTKTSVHTWVLSVDLVGGSGHVEVLGSAPKGVVEVEVADLSVELVGTDVALDKVVGGPLDGRPAVLKLTCSPKEWKTHIIYGIYTREGMQARKKWPSDEMWIVSPGWLFCARETASFHSENIYVSRLPATSYASR